MSGAGTFVQRATFTLANLGPVGWVGLAALLLALGGLLAVPALNKANAQQAESLDALLHQISRLQDPQFAKAARDPAATLLASLPADADVPDFVAAIQHRADQGAVQIDRTEYRVQPVMGATVRRYRLSFPAHVDYPHLRSWLEALLHDYPNLILDEITLRREVDGGEELEAHIGLSFLARVGK